MNKYYYVSHFGAAYGAGTYGACSYNEGNTTSGTTSCDPSATGSTGAGSSSSLTNTGFMIALIVTLACLLIFATLLIRMIRRAKQRKLALQEQEAQTRQQVDQPDNQ